MATINNKLIHFKSKSDFLSRYADTTDGGKTYGDFLGTSIVFIQDAKQIWTHGQFYDANEATLASLGITATAQELNYCDGVTSNIQTQLNEKQATITGGASSIVTGNLAALRALISNALGKVTVSPITSTELGCLDGVTSNIQTQLDGKLSLNGGGEITNEDGDTLVLPWYIDPAVNAIGWKNSTNDYAGFYMKYFDTSTQDLIFFKKSSTDTPEIIGQIIFGGPEVWISNKKLAFEEDYLPLTGGTLTGVLTLKGDSSTGNVIELDNDNAQSFNIVSDGGKSINIQSGDASLSVTSKGVVISGNNSKLITLKGSGKNQLIYSNSPISINCFSNELKISDRVNGLTFNDSIVLTEDNYSNYITSGDNVYYIDCSSFDSSSSDVSAISTALGGFQNFLDAVKAGKIICDRTDNFEEVTPNGTNIVYNITSVLADPTWAFTLTGVINGGWVILEISFDRLFTTASIKKTLIERGGISSSNTSSKSFLVGVDEQSDSAKSYSNANVYMQSGQLYATRMNATNGFFETSDARLKNFKDDIKALDIVSEIPTKYFTWKKEEIAENIDPKLHIGTSAQEVQKIYPDLVSENKEGILSVDYARLSIIAIAAIKELKAEINELKSKLN